MPPLKWPRPRFGRHARAGEAFSVLCGAALRQIEANRQGAVAAHDPEYLHQLRVGARRLRSTLRVFRPLLDRARARRLERRLKKSMRVLGRARDWDVFSAGLRESGAGEAFLARARRKRLAAQRRVRKAVATLPDGRTGQSLSVTADRRLASFARRALDKLHARVYRRAAGVDWRRPERRHAVRIAVKRLRYACDSFAPFFPGRAARGYLGDLEKLQDVLGELNDVAVAGRLLEKLGGNAKVERVLAGRERALIAALQPAWTAFEARRAFWSVRG